MTTYANLENLSVIVYAPDPLVIDGKVYQNPTADIYASADWWPVKENHPAPQLGFHEVETTPTKQMTESGQYVIYRNWQLVADPEPVEVPRKWTQFAIEIALVQKGWYTDIKNVLESIEYVPGSGYTLFRAFDISDYVQENYPTKEKWDEVLSMIAVKANKTKEEIIEFLDNVPTDPSATV